MLVNTALSDGKACAIELPQDPGQAGKAQAQAFVGLLTGYHVKTRPVTGDKVQRFAPFSAQAEAGNVVIVKGIPEAYLASLENFPPETASGHDDDADATSTAFEKFVMRRGGTNLIDFMRKQKELEARLLGARGGNPRGDRPQFPNQIHPESGTTLEPAEISPPAPEGEIVEEERLPHHPQAQGQGHGVDDH
jgi:predicted phage terminase large subunit-like protein